MDKDGSRWSQNVRNKAKETNYKDLTISALAGLAATAGLIHFFSGETLTAGQVIVSSAVGLGGVAYPLKLILNARRPNSALRRSIINN